jgi:hypothetical protein
VHLLVAITNSTTFNQMQMYSFLRIFSIIYPDEDLLVPKNVAMDTTKNKIVLIVFTY